MKVSQYHCAFVNTVQSNTGLHNTSGSSEELSKKKNNYVLRIKFSDTELLLHFDEAKKADADKFADLLKDVKHDCNKLFNWEPNPRFTMNAAYTECHEVTVISRDVLIGLKLIVSKLILNT